MKSKRTFLFKRWCFLSAILLALVFTFTAANCFADTDMVWTYHSNVALGKDYTSLSTWEYDTGIDITSANDVVVVSHGGLTGSIASGDTVYGAISTAEGVVVGVVTNTQICIDVESGDFQSGEQIYETQDVNYVVSTSAEDTLGRMYLDCYDGPHNDYVTIDGAITDSNHYRCIRSASDCSTPFAGKRETGAYFESTTDAAVFKVSEDYARLEHIGAKLTCNITNLIPVFDLGGGYAKAIGCVAYESVNTDGTESVVGFSLSGNNSIAVNCIAHNIELHGFRFAGSVYAYNCVAVDNGGYGFRVRSGTNNYVWNCVGDNNTAGDFETGFNGNSGYNMSSDTSALGTNKVISKDFTNMWINETDGSENYHLSATGGADSDFKGGADPAGTLDPPDYSLTDDIDEDTRSTWYRGADEWTLSVDDDNICEGLDPCYTTINAALGAATAGDTIKVFAGTYNENISMTDGVDVVNDPGYTPEIIGDGTTAVVTFGGAFSTGCTLDGFDISGGGTYPGIYLYGTGTGITNSTSVKNCNIHANSGPGIKLDGTAATTAPIIDNNDISSNTEEGIYIIDVGGSESTHATIVNNTISGNTKAGINIGGASYLTIDNNQIQHNYAGIAFDTGDPGNPSSQPVKIIGNDIFSNDARGGIGIVDAVTGKVTITQNDIHENARGGIGIQNSCDVDITKNSIHDNIRGGMHTGTDVADDVFNDNEGFKGGPGSAVLTIRQNKVYENGQSGYGGGIDVRHASGTIENNLVYKSHRGGIRFGWEILADPHVTIINNTVVNVGSSDPSRGGGIIYDNLAGAVNDAPGGTSPGDTDIKNNICAYNEMAGIRDGRCMSSRDYNLLYGNFRWAGCTTGCQPQQLGGCPTQTNEIFANPQFVDMDNDDYHLDPGPPPSPAIGAGEGGVDMGAYGGDYPIDW